MKILVTGATGFMGIRLVEALIKENHEVFALVRNIEKAKDVLHCACNLMEGDVTDKTSIEGMCDGIDVVYHLAALMGHDLPSESAFNKFRKVNVEGLKNVVFEAERAGVKRFIHVSSTAAFGLISEEVVDENTECKPYTPYQVTKYEGEKFVFGEIAKGFPAMIIRPTMVYGPGFKGDFVTMGKACKTGFFPKIGKKENLFPALYIDDLIKVFVLLVDKAKTGELYLISSSRSYSLDETANILGKSMNKRVRLIYVPRGLAVFGAGVLEKAFLLIKKKPPVTQRNILSATTNRTVKIDKLCSQIGYVPETSLEVGLPRAVKYFVEKGYL